MLMVLFNAIMIMSVTSNIVHIFKNNDRIIIIIINETLIRFLHFSVFLFVLNNIKLFFLVKFIIKE